MTFVCLKMPDVRTLGRRNAGRGLLRREVRKMEGSEGRRGLYIDFADAVHFDDYESYGLYKQGMRLRVYRAVVM